MEHLMSAERDDDGAPGFRPLGKQSRLKVSRKPRICTIGTGDDAMIWPGEQYRQFVHLLDGKFEISDCCVKCHCGFRDRMEAAAQRDHVEAAEQFERDKAPFPPAGDRS